MTKRRLAAEALTSLAAAVVAATVLVVWNPWRYLVLDRIHAYDQVIVGLTVTAVLLWCAGYLRGWPMSGFTMVAVTVVTGLMLFFGYWGLRALDAIRPETQQPPVTLALSGDGRYELIEINTHEDSSYHHRDIWLRSRAGLFSRESPRPLSTLWYAYSEPGVPTVTATRFSGPREVELTTSDGRTWTIRFHPRTLAPDRTLYQCDSDYTLCWRPD